MHNGPCSMAKPSQIKAKETNKVKLKTLPLLASVQAISGILLSPGNSPPRLEDI